MISDTITAVASYESSADRIKARAVRRMGELAKMIEAPTNTSMRSATH